MQRGGAIKNIILRAIIGNDLFLLYGGSLETFRGVVNDEEEVIEVEADSTLKFWLLYIYIYISAYNILFVNMLTWEVVPRTV